MAHASQTIGAAAQAAALMIDAGDPLIEIWRHGILQLLDDYEGVRRREGQDEAAALLTQAPDPTGDRRVDAAFAGLTEHLARRDGWQPPAWTSDEDRTTGTWWFVPSMSRFHPRALIESPLSFRKRGVFITSDGLERV